MVIGVLLHRLTSNKIHWHHKGRTILTSRTQSTVVFDTSTGGLARVGFRRGKAMTK